MVSPPQFESHKLDRIKRSRKDENQKNEISDPSLRRRRRFRWRY